MFLSVSCIDIYLVNDTTTISGLDETITLTACADNVNQILSSGTDNSDGSKKYCGLRVNEGYSYSATAKTYESTSEDCGNTLFGSIPSENNTNVSIPMDRSGKENLKYNLSNLIHTKNFLNKVEISNKITMNKQNLIFEQ